MNEEEKKAFLRKMGYSGSCLRNDEIKKSEKKDNRFDKSELLALSRKFDVVPNNVQKQQSLSEFLT
jgi:hypothetical protein